MKDEYVRLYVGEKNFGYRSLLQTQLGLLNSVNSFRSYKLLRQDELKLKISLKSKVGEAIVILDRLMDLLPKTKMPHEHREVKTIKEEEKLTLQGEIEEIRKKIQSLQIGF